MQRSSHLMDLCMASFILTASGEVVTMTSSSCIIMSEPMVFCSDIECSGVRSLYAVRTGILQLSPGMDYIGVPSWGLEKHTPSSVTLASSSKLTIWKLPHLFSVRYALQICTSYSPSSPEDSPATVCKNISFPTLQNMSTSNYF